MVTKWSSSTRLDEYYTVKGLRREIALVDENSDLYKKPIHQLNKELVCTLSHDVDMLNKTLKAFGMFSDNSRDLRKRVDIMKRVREELGSVFLSSLRVANSMDIDVSQSVKEKIYPALQALEKIN